MTRLERLVKERPAREAKVSERRERERYLSEPIALAFFEQPEKCLSVLGSLILGSVPRDATAYAPAHVKAYLARRSLEPAIDRLRENPETHDLKWQPLGEPRP